MCYTHLHGRLTMKFTVYLVALFLILVVVIPSTNGDDDTGIGTSIAVRKAALHLSIQGNALGTPDAQPVLAYLRRLPLNDTSVQELVDKAGDSSNSDFAISILVRILFFVGNTKWKKHYDKMILPTLKEENYWFTTECCGLNDDSMASENHMILWMSSSWLLKQREGWEMGPTLRQRLVHYLNLKIKYGFYEFLSASYWTLSMKGLLNLVDFCEDLEIQSLAERAVRRLISDNLLFVNSKGIKYSVSGRDYAERFVSEDPYALDQDGITYLLTGRGKLTRKKRSASVGPDSFLSTSSIDLSDLASQWQPSVDTTFEYGHSLADGFKINADLDKFDRIAFQFSQGAYFHPDVAQDTLEFIQRFAPVTFTGTTIIDEWIRIIPSSLAPVAASNLKWLGKGSVLSQGNIHLYRNQGSMLSSVQDFWPGYVGFQSFVWMGVCDDIAVFTQSGRVFENWIDKSGIITNSHLPAINQIGNVALIMYYPKSAISLLYKDVALFWPNERFDEVKVVQGKDEADNIFGWLYRMIFRIFDYLIGGFSTLSKKGNWVVGRKGMSYIAVYRPCGDRIDKGWFSCSGDAGQQVWATVVGDASKHGSFEQFLDVISAASVESSMETRFRRLPAYVATIKVDKKTVHHEFSVSKD